MKRLLIIIALLHFMVVAYSQNYIKRKNKTIVAIRQVDKISATTVFYIHHSGAKDRIAIELVDHIRAGDSIITFDANKAPVYTYSKGIRITDSRERDKIEKAISKTLRSERFTHNYIELNDKTRIPIDTVLDIGSNLLTYEISGEQYDLEISEILFIVQGNNYITFNSQGRPFFRPRPPGKK